MTEHKFGCNTCRATPEKGAGKQDLPFELVSTLIHSSHLSFFLCQCKYCRQPYLEQFYELIDWSGEGKDKMWNRWVPLTHDEVAELNLDASLEEEREYAAENLKEIMLRRQRLVMDPEKEFSWSDNQADPIDLTAPG